MLCSLTHRLAFSLACACVTGLTWPLAAAWPSLARPEAPAASDAGLAPVEEVPLADDLEGEQCRDVERRVYGVIYTGIGLDILGHLWP